MENELTIKDLYNKIVKSKGFILKAGSIILALLLLLFFVLYVVTSNKIYTSSFKYIEFAEYNETNFNNGEAADLMVEEIKGIYETSAQKTISVEHFQEFLENDLIQVTMNHSYNYNSLVNIYDYQLTLKIDDIIESYEYSENDLTTMQDTFTSDAATYVYNNKLSLSLLPMFEEAYANADSNIIRISLFQYTLNTLRVKYDFYHNNYEEFYNYITKSYSSDYTNIINKNEVNDIGEILTLSESEVATINLIQSELWHEKYDIKFAYDFEATNNSQFYSKIEYNLSQNRSKQVLADNTVAYWYFESNLNHLNNMKSDFSITLDSGKTYTPYTEYKYEDYKSGISTIVKNYDDIHSTSNGHENDANILLQGSYQSGISTIFILIAIFGVSVMVPVGLVIVGIKK